MSRAVGPPDLDADPAWRLAAALLLGYRGHARRTYFAAIDAPSPAAGNLASAAATITEASDSVRAGRSAAADIALGEVRD